MVAEMWISLVLILWVLITGVLAVFGLVPRWLPMLVVLAPVVLLLLAWRASGGNRH